jgi:hypothetical protein
MVDAVARALDNKSKKYLAEITDITSASCYLNPSCKLRDESKIKAMVADMQKALGKTPTETDSTTKTTIDSDETAVAMWKRITTSALGSEKEDLAKFFSYLVIKCAPSEAVAEKCHLLINKGLYGKESTAPASLGMSEVLNKLELYNKLIADIKIDSSNVEKTLEILFSTKNIPDGVK